MEIKLDESMKKEILRQCFKKSMCNNSYCLDDEKIGINIKKVGTIRFSGKGIKKYAKVYLCKFASPEEKKLYSEYKAKLKKCYEVYRKILEDKESKDKIISESGLNLSYNTILRKAHKYCYSICNMSEEEVRALYRKQGKYSLILDGLMSLEKDEDIIKYLDKYCESDLRIITSLRTAIFDYAIRRSNKLSKEERNNLKEVLRKKVNVYANYTSSFKKDIKLKNNEIERDKRNKKELAIAKEILIDFIKSKMKEKEYLELNNIESGVFQRYKRILEACDPDTYKFYRERKEFQNWDSYIRYGLTVKSLLNDINKGIGTGDNKREFDILDYYLMYNAPLDELSRAIEYKDRDINYADYLRLRQFISSHMEDKVLDVDKTLQTNLEIDSKRDNRGYPIPGTGRVINKEERENIIFYLEEKSVPLTNETYRIALKRYIEGTKNNEKSTNKLLEKDLIVSN